MSAGARRQRRGFALPAVMGVLILMGMLVAVAAQRALVAARAGHLAEVRADVDAAMCTGAAQALAQGPDTAWLRVLPPGVDLDSGQAVVGTATAAWRLRTAGAGVVALSVDARAAWGGTVARGELAAWLRPATDSARGLRWGAAGPGWWLRVPAS